MTENLTYETKCRRCGVIQEWHFSARKDVKWEDFTSFIIATMNEPERNFCEKCNKETVQDFVSYSSKE